MPHCHLITDQAACCQCTSVFATWDIIRQYADWPDKTLDDMMQLIDTLANGFMLPHPHPVRSHICTGKGNCICIGINTIKIPCQCTPSHASFITSPQANITMGHAVHNPAISMLFPMDGTLISQCM